MISSLSDTRRVSDDEGLEVRELRALVAKHLHLDVRRVTDQAHLRRDLGAGWLDRLELLMLIEDQFIDVEIADDTDRIEVVADLIRCVEGARGRGRGAPIDALVR